MKTIKNMFNLAGIRRTFFVLLVSLLQTINIEGSEKEVVVEKIQSDVFISEIGHFLNRSMDMLNDEKAAVVKGFMKGMADEGKTKGVEVHRYQASLYLGNGTYRKEIYGIDDRSATQLFYSIDRAESLGYVIAEELHRQCKSETFDHRSLANDFEKVLKSGDKGVEGKSGSTLPSHIAVHRLSITNIMIGLKNLESSKYRE